MQKGYSFVYTPAKNGETAVYIKRNYRDAAGRSRSISIGKVGLRSSFPTEEALKEAADRVYREWKGRSGDRATVTFSQEADVEQDWNVSLGRYYIVHALNELRIPLKLSSLKGEKKERYKFDLADVAQSLIVAQILSPGSKRHEFSDPNLDGLFEGVEMHQVYRTLDVLARHSDEINAYSYKRVSKLLSISSRVYYYDCTNFYYTQGSEGTLLGMKKSKEGIYAPLVQLGLLIDEWGLLVGMIVFNGNEGEQMSLKEQIRRINSHIKMDQVVICTDAGLCSFSNKIVLSRNGRSYITTQPILGTAVPGFVRKWVTLGSGYRNAEGKPVTPSSVIERYQELCRRIEENKEDSKAEREELRRLLDLTLYKDAWFEAEVVRSTATKGKGKRKKWTRETIDVNKEDFESSSGKEDVDYTLCYTREVNGSSEKLDGSKFQVRLFTTFCLKYYLHDMKSIDEKVAKVEKLSGRDVDGIDRDYRKYADVDHVTRDGEVATKAVVSINDQAVEEDRKYAGYYVQATNLGDDCMELFALSRMRWQIEYCFRTMKTQFRSRPIYLTDENHIIGHFTLVFLALQTMKYMMYRLYRMQGHTKCVLGRADTGGLITIDSVVEELRNLRGVRMRADEGFDFVMGAPKNDLNMLMAKAFGFSLTKQMIRMDRLRDYELCKDKKYAE